MYVYSICTGYILSNSLKPLIFLNVVSAFSLIFYSIHAQNKELSYILKMYRHA